LQISREANELAREQMGMSREQFAYFQENAKEELALARQQADRLFEFQNKAFESDEEAKAFARQVGQTQIDAMNLQQDYAKRDRERYEQTFLPMQDQYIKEAQEYDTAARREEAAGGAMADTQRQAEAARANADQRLRGMGLDPSQMRSASLLQTQDVMGAAQQAAAANQERQRIENQGRAMRADAMNLGMGLPAQAAAGFAGSGQSGQGALGAGQAGQQAQLNAIQGGAGVGGQAMGFRSGALNNIAQLTGSPMQWASLGSNSYGQALGGFGAAGNTMNQGYQNSMNQWQAGQQQKQQMMSNVMGAAGMAAGAWAEGGPVGRNYAEGGEVNRYYAEGDFVAPPAQQPAMQPAMRPPMSRGVIPPPAGGYAPPPTGAMPAGGGRMMPGQYGTGAGASPMAGMPPPGQQPVPGRQQAQGQQPFYGAEGGGVPKAKLNMRERMRKGMMLASMAPENSWTGGDTSVGQYAAPLASLRNEEFRDPAAAVPAAQTAAPAQINKTTTGMLQPQQTMQNPYQQQPMYAAEGGQARGPMRARGAVPTRQSRDDIAAYLAEGEYVLPADVVRAIGIEKLDKMVAKYHRENA